MGEAETKLEKAERHVAEQRQRIFDQHARIGHLRAMGLPTGEAEKLLDLMEDLLAAMMRDLDRLSN